MKKTELLFKAKITLDSDVAPIRYKTWAKGVIDCSNDKIEDMESPDLQKEYVRGWDMYDIAD